MLTIGKNFLGVVRAAVAGVVAGVLHHIIVLDRSGSMSWVAKQCAEDVINALKDIPDGDFVSIGDFSGEGDWNWYVKGVRLDTDSDRQYVAEIIRRYAYGRNTTCFSEILTDMATVIEHTKGRADGITFSLLTDGHPVVRNQRTEREMIFKALNGVKDDIVSALVVGYGNYYNRDLCTMMAKTLGGIMQHANRITDFGHEVGKVTVSRGTKRTVITIPSDAEVVFTFTDSGVNIHSVDDGKASVPTGADVYYSSPDPVEVDELPDQVLPMYASALVAMQTGKTDDALDIISDIGDVAIADMLGSAITLDEFGRAEAAIMAAFRPENRFMKGRRIGCAPDPNAPDLLDVLDILAADPEARFYPFHDDFEYRRIGRKSKVKEGYPEFVREERNPGVPFTDLVWNQDRMNLSVRASFNGQVPLQVATEDGKTYEGVGFSPWWPTTTFRNYTLVANGYPNMDSLPVTCGPVTWAVLDKMGVLSIAERPYFTLHLDRVPVLSRGKRGDLMSDVVLGEMAVKSQFLAGKLKGLRTILKEIDPDDALRKTPLTPDQEAVLKANGISWNGTFSPPTEQEEATDVLPMREFQVKIAGMASLPSLNHVRKKIEAGKKLTTREGLVYEGLIDFDHNVENAPLKEQVNWLKTEIDRLEGIKKALDDAVQQQKFVMAMTKAWFPGKSRAETTTTVPYDGENYTVNWDLRQVDVKI